ncbi:MAG: cupin domain-containing protein [Ramlibacter sp.]
MEVLLGTIAPGGRGLPHAHPSLEQVGIILAGRAVSKLGGLTRELRAGDVDFIPKNVMHAAEVVGDEALQLIVIYAPPYLERPEARVFEADAHDRSAEVHPAVALPPIERSREGLGENGITVVPVLDAQSAGARHIEISHVRMAPAGGLELSAARGAERLLIVRDGSVSSAGQEAMAGDWVFIPDLASCAFRAGADGLDAILVSARSEPLAAA